MMQTEITIEAAFKELRFMFPRGLLRIECSETKVDHADDPEGDDCNYTRIVVSRATPDSAKSWISTSLADCLDQIRVWRAQ
jgi:hypothetical protein